MSAFRLFNKSGFTLVELLIVISIISILTTIGVAYYGNIQQGVRNAKRKEDIEAIAKALEVQYNGITNVYPKVDASFFANAIPQDPTPTSNSCDGGYCGYCFNPASNCSNSSTSVTGWLGGASTYKVCANLEPTGVFCLLNQR